MITKAFHGLNILSILILLACGSNKNNNTQETKTRTETQVESSSEEKKDPVKAILQKVDAINQALSSFTKKEYKPEGSYELEWTAYYKDNVPRKLFTTFAGPEGEQELTAYYADENGVFFISQVSEKPPFEMKETITRKVVQVFLQNGKILKILAKEKKLSEFKQKLTENALADVKFQDVTETYPDKENFVKSLLNVYQGIVSSNKK